MAGEPGDEEAGDDPGDGLEGLVVRPARRGRQQARRIDPGAGDDIEIGPLVSAAHFDRVVGYLDRAAQQGIRAAIGGGALPGPGYFVAPTVLVDVPDGAECSRQEIFGPVVTVETFTDEDEAIRAANDTEYGLVSFLYTQDLRRAIELSERLDAGMVGLNQGMVSNAAAPFGGVKQSGFGREGGKEGIDEYLEIKYVAMNV